MYRELTKRFVRGFTRACERRNRLKREAGEAWAGLEGREGRRRVSCGRRGHICGQVAYLLLLFSIFRLLLILFLIIVTNILLIFSS
ncbi:hypothetical protein E2C01_000587 [Portunus trituberculatus]|uniref:Uncharacterized protein n=1 Tax=Portunus trituberculatus TaxID=210409 RepID=A0A5B7CFK9_PORTR|nr:hypothetical protein [Portunus trituberculatus]